jgi:hypothetical protein
VLRREQVRYLIEGAPLLLLPKVPELAGLPRLRVTAEGAVAQCAGWRLAARLAMTIVDGPGDQGVAVQGATGPGEDSEHMLGWCEAVLEQGGAVVLAFAGWDAGTTADELMELAQANDAQGGAVQGLPPG